MKNRVSGFQGFRVAGLLLALPVAVVAAPNYVNNSVSEGRAGYDAIRPAYIKNPQALRNLPTSTSQATPATSAPNYPISSTTPQLPETSTGETAAVKAEREACLLTQGNVWASITFASAAGVPASSALTANENPNENTCYAKVSVKSSETREVENAFGERYFQTGTSLNCGSWVDGGKLDSIILDNKKGSRIAGTVIASVAGAGVGVGLTELIGRQINGFEGQKDLKGNALLKSQLLELKKDNVVAIGNYRVAMAELKRLCDSAPQKPADCTRVNYNEILAILGEIGA